MINLTDILTKPVLSLSASKCGGIVKTGIFNQSFKRLKHLVLFDNEEDLEEKVLSINSIYSNGENAIIIKDDQYLTPFSATTNNLDKPSPINSKVYTFLGKYLGIVTDVVLTNTYYIHSIKINEKEILFEDIISSGQNILIVQDENQKAKISSLKRRKTKCVKIQDIKISKDQKVYILDPEKSKTAIQNSQNSSNLNLEENLSKQTDHITPNNIKNEDIQIINPTFSIEKSNLEQQNINSIQEKQVKPKVVYNLTEAPSQPGLVISNFEFLIGRKLEQNIYSNNNELIAKKNTKITTDTIIKARLFNKTRELVKFSH